MNLEDISLDYHTYPIQYTISESILVDRNFKLICRCEKCGRFRKKKEICKICLEKAVERAIVLREMTAADMN